jgi:ribA/ribD-fused uncharacterized protein
MSAVEAPKMSGVDAPIDFFSQNKDQYAKFSNYHILSKPITIDGLQYSSTEAYYHAMKFLKDPDDQNHQEYREIIRQARTPNQSKALGNQKHERYPSVFDPLKDKRLINDIITQYKSIVTIRPDWDDLRNSVMAVATEAKYTQDPRLMKLLLSTGTRVIREASPYDSYWGIGRNGKGHNMLGIILMMFRDQQLGCKQSQEYYEQLTASAGVKYGGAH